jgi:type IV pilus assembly protein PilC
MPTFAYAGRTRAGTDGERRAHRGHDGRGVAALRREQIQITKIDAVKAKAEAKPKAAKKGGVKVPAKNLAIFVRQFSVMIDAGLPLVQCLDILGRQDRTRGSRRSSSRPGRRRAGRGARRRDEEAREDLRPLYSNMIAAARPAAFLDTILKRLATYIEKSVKLKGEVKSAMIYPVAVIVIAAVGRRRDSLEGHPDVRAAVLGPRRPAAAPDPRRHLRQQRHRGLRVDS